MRQRGECIGQQACSVFYTRLTDQLLYSFYFSKLSGGKIRFVRCAADSVKSNSIQTGQHTQLSCLRTCGPVPNIQIISETQTWKRHNAQTNTAAPPQESRLYKPDWNKTVLSEAPPQANTAAPPQESKLCSVRRHECDPFAQCAVSLQSAERESGLVVCPTDPATTAAPQAIAGIVGPVAAPQALPIGPAFAPELQHCPGTGR